MNEASTAPLALCTGANGGIGRAYARQMLEQGFDLVAVGRRMPALEELAAQLRIDFPQRRITPMTLDVGDAEAIHAFGREFSARFERLDVLMHCAGVYFFDDAFRRTSGGHELNYATHVLGPHALTMSLLEPLRRAKGARVVMVSSSEHRRARGDRQSLRPLESTAPFDNIRAYNESKWATLLLATALQRRFADDGENIEVLGAHPGLSITGIQHRGNPNAMQRAAIWLLGKLVAGPPEGAARALVMASMQGRAGEFYGPTGFMEARGTPGLVEALPSTKDGALADELLGVLERLAGEGEPLAERPTP